MKDQYISELKTGQTVKDKFILTKKIIKEKKDGGSYAILEFTDRSGSIEGIAWNNTVQDLKALSVDDLVLVWGSVSEYNERLQIVVNSIEKIPDQEIEPKDFLPSSEEDIDQVMEEIRAFINKIANPHLKKLLESFFDDRDFVERFRIAPAAKRLHHSYLGGLAVHTLKILRVMSHIHKVYRSLNHDLLIAGGILHDIGKIQEYVYTKKFDLSTGGRMLGHIAIGYGMIVEKIAKQPGFPEELSYKILHMILSHHGEFEWGSPKLPVFPEALILHFIDNLDAKIDMMVAESKKYRGEKRIWSDYHPYLEREIYLPEEE